MPRRARLKRVSQDLLAEPKTGCRRRNSPFPNDGAAYLAGYVPTKLDEADDRLGTGDWNLSLELEAMRRTAREGALV